VRKSKNIIEMKKLYILIFTTVTTLSFSQISNPQQLLNKDWRLEKIIKAGTEMLPPPPVTILQSDLTYISSLDKYSFYPRYYNSGNCLMTFVAGENAFTFDYSQVPFIYSGENAEAVNNFDKMMLNFYLDYRTQKYYYDYNESGGVYFMTITNPAGDKMYFKSLVELASAESQMNRVRLYPNPVSDYIQIDTQQYINSVKITDAAGEIILSESPKKKNHQINLQKLPGGIYYISINNEKADRFIKK